VASTTSTNGSDGASSSGARHRDTTLTGVAARGAGRALRATGSTAMKAAEAVERRLATPRAEVEPFIGKEQEPYAAQPSYVTVAFADEAEFVRFTDYVEQRLGGAGLQFTDAPLIWSIRVTPQLLAATKDQFALHPVASEEIAAVEARYRARPPFNEETLDEFLGG